MDSADFSVLVGRLEREADDRPRGYVIKVALVAALGYALIAVAVLAILWVCVLVVDRIASGERVGGFLIGLALAGLMTLFAIVRALWVRIDPPLGRDVTRDEAPELFAALDDVLQRMANAAGEKSKPITIDTVTLDGDLNASICQIPRFGVFGGYRNYLQIGLPLMAALSAAEFKAVLAHEVGHLSGSHGKFSSWIYRQRRTWHALEKKFDESSNIFEQLLGTFYGWYAPYFYAYSFVLARSHEYAADRDAAKATHPQVLARALIKLDLLSRFINQVFWPRLFAQVERMPEPLHLPYSVMPKVFVTAKKEWLRTDWLQESVRAFAAEGDTHPGLGERLAALDVQPELPTVADKSSLALLGTTSNSLLKWCDDEWKEENVPAWRKRHTAIKEARWKISQYESTPAAEMKPEDLWQKAMLHLDLGNDHEAIDTLQTLIALDSSIAKAHYILGRLLLQYADEQGLHHLTIAGQQDAEITDTARQIGYDYLVQRGRKGEAQRFAERTRAA